jgi:hypothetical protein
VNSSGLSAINCGVTVGFFGFSSASPGFAPTGSTALTIITAAKIAEPAKSEFHTLLVIFTSSPHTEFKLHRLQSQLLKPFNSLYSWKLEK